MWLGAALFGVRLHVLHIRALDGLRVALPADHAPSERRSPRAASPLERISRRIGAE